jgi:hypothetical protein
MEKIFISLGTDCGVASILKNLNLRFCSLPFDWVVTYNGVNDIITNNFIDYLPKDNNVILSHSNFPHNKFPDDYEKMNNRINRFIELLKIKNKELIFIRKGHYIHHHDEVKEKGYLLKNDLIDCEELFIFLKNKYPELKFQIKLFLCCHHCFDSTKEYISKNVDIYNISTNISINEKDQLFEKKINEIKNK